MVAGRGASRTSRTTIRPPGPGRARECVDGACAYQGAAQPPRVVVAHGRDDVRQGRYLRAVEAHYAAEVHEAHAAVGVEDVVARVGVGVEQAESPQAADREPVDDLSPRVA